MPLPRSAYAGFALALAAGLLLASARAEEPPACVRPLRVGWYPWAPYHYEKADGTLTGSGVEILRLAAKSAGCELEFQTVPWQRGLADVESGRIDVLMEALPIRERQRYAHFSRGYSPTRICLWLRAGDKRPVPDSLEQLAASAWRIGLTAGFSYGETLDRWLAEHAQRGLVETVRRDEQNLLKLVGGNIDATFSDWVGFQQSLGEPAHRKAVRCARAYASAPDGAFMFSRKSVPANVSRRISEALDALDQDGRLSRILRRFGSIPPEDLVGAPLELIRQ